MIEIESGSEPGSASATVSGSASGTESNIQAESELNGHSTVQLHPSVSRTLAEYGIEYEVMLCLPELADTRAFCQHYGIALCESANAILIAAKTEPASYACALVLATCKLDVNKKMRNLMGDKKCSFASADETLSQTGMMLGGITPLGLNTMPIYIDAKVIASPRVVIGGGNRTTKVVVAPKELLKLPGTQVIEDLAIPLQDVL